MNAEKHLAHAKLLRDTWRKKSARNDRNKKEIKIAVLIAIRFLPISTSFRPISRVLLVLA